MPRLKLILSFFSVDEDSNVFSDKSDRRPSLRKQISRGGSSAGFQLRIDVPGATGAAKRVSVERLVKCSAHNISFYSLGAYAPCSFEDVKQACRLRL